MEALKSLVFGIVQGLTEFLPVSSSGHFVLLAKLGLGENDIFFNVLLHLGTLAAVVWYLRADIAQILKRPFGKETMFLLAATAPAAVLALLIKYFVPELLYGKYLAAGFAVTTALLVCAEVKSRSAGPAEIGLKTSLFAGIAQGIAVLPGISRSGATLSALLYSGIDRERAAKFSFLMSIPIIIAGAVEESLSLTAMPSAQELLISGVGVLAAFFTGLFALRFLTAVIKSKNLLPFAAYTAVMAGISLALIGI